MAGMGLENAAAGTAGFEGLRNWLADALKMRAIQQAEQDRITGAERQRVLDTRAGETHGLNMRRGQQLITHGDAQEGREASEFAQGQAGAQAKAADIAARLAEIDAMPGLSEIQKWVAKASVRSGGSPPGALLDQPAAPKLREVETVEAGRPVKKFLPEDQLAGQTFQQYVKPDAPAGPSNEPLTAITDPQTGEPRLVPRSQAVGMRPASTRDQALTEGQSNAAGFAERMQFNEPAIQGYEGSVGRGSQLQGWLPGEMQSDGFQQYQAAKKNWIAAQLRKESGAAISQGEYDEADRQYFPQPGDSAGTIAQKRELRAVAQASMRRASGSAGTASGINRPGDRTQGRTVTQAQLAKLAQKRGTDVQTQAARAAAAGYTVID
jgi:hypothetical protein